MEIGNEIGWICGLPITFECLCFQIARLRSELDIVRGNVKVMSEMLTEMVPGQEDASDLELLQVL